MTELTTMQRIDRCIVLSKVYGLERSPIWWLRKMAGYARTDGRWFIDLDKYTKTNVYWYLAKWEERLADPAWVAKAREMFSTPKPGA